MYDYDSVWSNHNTSRDLYLTNATNNVSTQKIGKNIFLKTVTSKLINMHKLLLIVDNLPYLYIRNTNTTEGEYCKVFTMIVVLESSNRRPYLTIMVETST